MSTVEEIQEVIGTLCERELMQVLNFANFVKSGGLDIPNDDTLEAIKEVEEMEKNPDKYKAYTNVKEMFAEILADV